MHATPLPLADRPAPADIAASDAVLVARFAQTHDEPAFAELVSRHGPLVMGVCRRVLDRAHDAEDAFQAVFMALAKSADRVRVGPTLAPWLYGVAYRIAVRAAQQRSRRQESAMPQDVMDNRTSLDNVEASHRLHVLEEELNGLPAKYRDPLVLHHLLGKTNREIAAELGLSVRTVEGRQRRGKAALRRQLSLRRVSLPLAAAALAANQQASMAAVPTVLLEQTVSASLCFAAGEPCVADSPAVSILAQSEAIAMSTSASSPLIAVIAAVVIVGGAAAVANQPVGKDASGAPLVLASTDAGGAHAATAADEAALPVASVAAVEPAPPARSRAAARRRSPAIGLTGAALDIEYSLANYVTNLHVNNKPLAVIIDMLAEQADVPVVFDEPALDEVGLSPDIEVSVVMPDVQFRSALNQTLRNASPDLAYLIQDEVLLITSRDRAENHLETRTYRVDELASTLEMTTSELSKLILDTAGPAESWEAMGGQGDVFPVSNHGLVIRQTQAIHREVAALLQQLGELASE